MFHPALWKLFRLQWRGGFRQFFHSLRTVRGLFQLMFVVAMIAQVSITGAFSGAFGSNSSPFAGSMQELVNDFLPLGLFFASVYVIVFSTGDATVYFTPSEVAFLFPAPMTRKQLLAYKLLNSILGIALISSIFSVVTSLSLGEVSMMLPRAMAFMMTLSFMQLLTMVVSFLRQVVREKIHVVVRSLFGVFIGVIVVAAVMQTMQSTSFLDYTVSMKAFRESLLGTLMVAPFQIFVQAIRAPDWASFCLPGLGLLAIDSCLLGLTFQLDALSLEAALATSEKMAARIKQIRSKGVWQAFGSANSAVASRRIPQLPFWGGVGPVIWQRMTTTFRTSTKLLWVPAIAFVAASLLVFGINRSNPAAGVAPFAGMVLMGYMSFLVSLMIQNDIERVGFLKSLPLTEPSIVIGDLIGFPILFSAFQSVFMLGEACFFPNLALWLVLGSCLTLPLNFVLFGIDKLVFYIYPTRLAKGAPGDFQGAGKQMIYITLKMLMVGAAIVIGAVAALPGALLLQSPLAAIVSIGLVLIIECAILIPLLTVAFRRFDPGVTQVS